jgi:hypothetical protein
MTRIILTHAADDANDDLSEIVATVELWWDAGTRCWVVQSKNAAGSQVGEAPYLGHITDGAYEYVRQVARTGAAGIFPKSARALVRAYCAELGTTYVASV